MIGVVDLWRRIWRLRGRWWYRNRWPLLRLIHNWRIIHPSRDFEVTVIIFSQKKVKSAIERGSSCMMNGWATVHIGIRGLSVFGPKHCVLFFFFFPFFIGRKITSINNKQKLHHLIKKKYTSWKRVCSNKQRLSLIYAEKSQMPKTCIDNKCASLLLVDMAKRVSRVKTGRGLSRVTGWVELRVRSSWPVFFKQIFFFF